MRRFLTATVVAVSLVFASCAQIQKTYDVFETLTQTQVTPKQAYIAISGFDAVKVVATAYVRRPPCGGTNTFCRDPEATRIIIISINQGTVARNAVKATARKGNVTGYDALIQATSSLSNIFTQYQIGR